MAEYQSLIQNRESTLNRFRDLYASLKKHETAPESTVEHNGAKLIHQPLRLYQRPNLKLIRAGFGADMQPADIIRCFNVLVYFDRDFRKNAEEWALRTLRPGGIFICGFNVPTGSHSRYTVYRNESGALVPKEFAFGIEYLRNFGSPWFAMHDEEQETWSAAKLVGVLRSNETFRLAHDSFLDRFLDEERLMRRQPDGYLGASPNPRPMPEIMAVYQKLLSNLRSEFSPRAVEVLRDAGFDSWVNSVGDVAVRPVLH
jgi:hypothetical protein